MNNYSTSLISPSKVWSYSEIFVQPCPLLKKPGVYAWYFKEIPPLIDFGNCGTFDGLYLLYVGISPSKPPQNGKSPSEQTIYDRIRFHFKGNAYGSTLRLTLGCLLSERLGIQLRRVGSENRFTFWKGEKVLSEWMYENAYVNWIYYDEPWILEEQLISSQYLPLNLEKNKHNMNHDIVSSARRKAKSLARDLPIVSGNY